MKNNKKSPISVKLICEIGNKPKAFLVNKYGRKLNLEIEKFDLINHYFYGTIDDIIKTSEIRFTGVIKLNGKNKNQIRYIIKGK